MYLLQRLKEIGVDHIFGVPGDYNLTLLDAVERFDGIEWIGTCNELNGAYACDAYARTKGVGALITTFGVGELSALNGIAGAYAERCPVIHIVGMPSLAQQSKKALLHHTLGGGTFSVFSEISQKVTVAHALLKDHSAGKEIDSVLEENWKQKKPVYIGLPTDIVNLSIEAPTSPIKFSYPPSDPDAVAEAASEIKTLIRNAKNPIILSDICGLRFNMTPDIIQIIETTGIPFATMNMSKGVINESHPLFIGDYCGDFSSPHVQDRVENADLVLAFGTLLTDLNTGGFTVSLNLNAEVQIHSNWTQIKHALYFHLSYKELLDALIAKLTDYKYTGKAILPRKKTPLTSSKTLSQSYFWQRIESFLPAKSNLIFETGTSLFGGFGITLPDHAQFIAQPLWASIGYSVGALLGTMIADEKNPTFLFVGDGSFQLTAQEISTLMRHKKNPTIFLINNSGYTIERIIQGATMNYNDIHSWSNSKLPSIFNDHFTSYQVKSPQELESTLKELKTPSDKLRFVEVFLPKMDCPELLKNIVAAQKRAH